MSSVPDQQKGVLRPPGRPAAGAVRRILVCLDRSPAAEAVLPLVETLARSDGSEIDLLHVIDDGAVGRSAPPDAVGSRIARAEADAYLSDVARRLGERGLRCRTTVLEGHAAEQILCFGDSRGTDLIVLSSHGEKGVTEWCLGSTTEKVLERSRAAVLVVPVGRREPRAPAESGSLERILILLDGSPRAEAALPLLQRIARGTNATLVLMHAATPPQVFASDEPPREDVELARRLQSHNAQEARRYLARVCGRLRRDGCEARDVVEEGDPRLLAADVAAREGIDLIAFTSHGTTGERGRAFGNTAGHLLRTARVPTLMVQSLPQPSSEFAEAVRHRREAAPLRGGHGLAHP